MTIRTIIAAAVLATTTLLATPTEAHSLLPSISPGDQIDYISDQHTGPSAPWATSTPVPMSTCTA